MSSPNFGSRQSLQNWREQKAPLSCNANAIWRVAILQSHLEAKHRLATTSTLSSLSSQPAKIFKAKFTHLREREKKKKMMMYCCSLQNEKKKDGKYGIFRAFLNRIFFFKMQDSFPKGIFFSFKRGHIEPSPTSRISLAFSANLIWRFSS